MDISSTSSPQGEDQLVRDEALARTLQILEDEAGSNASSSTSAATAPPPPRPPPAPTAAVPPQRAAATTPLSTMDPAVVDPAIAEQLRIEAEIMQRNQQQQAASAPPPPPVLIPPEILDPTSSGSAVTDEEMARRMEQEFNDEEMARRAQAEEDERRRMRMANANANSGVGGVGPIREHGGGRNRDGGCKRPICFVTIPIIAVTILVLFLTVFQKTDRDNLPPFFTDKWGGLPKNEATGEYAKWRETTDNHHSGLELVIINALSPDWKEYFDEAVRDWDVARALSLRTVRVERDVGCSPVRGRMKVCNGDYGRTGWTGLNEVYFENGFISSSVAKMNEAYLRGEGESLKQYVMCHEIGHGFGLPHRDENPNNKDLGTCMDYTNRPQNNMRPDDRDFKDLADLYDTVQTVQQQQTGVGANTSEKAGANDSNDGGGRHRHLLRRNIPRFAEGEILQLSVLKHETDTFRIYEHDLGDGAKVVTTLFLTPP